MFRRKFGVPTCGFLSAGGWSSSCGRLVGAVGAAAGGAAAVAAGGGEGGPRASVLTGVLPARGSSDTAPRKTVIYIYIIYI